MQREKLKKKLLNKKEPELKDLKNSQPINIAKNEKPHSAENTWGVAGQSLHEECDAWISSVILVKARNRDGVILAETLPI